MGSKNVYVSETDLPILERAAELAGGMSTAVVAGVRLYVAQQERERKLVEMSSIEVTVQDGPVVATKRFVGRQVLRYELGDGMRTQTFRVYLTAKGQYAVHSRNDPDWSKLSTPDDDSLIWEDTRTWSTRWWETTERALRVFPDITAMQGELPSELVEAIVTAAGQPTIEELDI